MRGMLAAAAVFALLAVGAWVSRSSSDPRAGSTEISGERVRVGARLPRMYRIAYRLEDGTKEVFLVRRPFESRTTTVSSAFGRSGTSGISFFAPPGPPVGDLRPDAVLGDAIRDGYASKREVRRVVGRLCRVYRIGSVAGAGSLPLVGDMDDPTDVCVDAAGLVLEEVTYRGDEVAQRRVAEAVSEHPRVTDSTFDLNEPEGDPRQIGSVQELRADSRLPGGTFWELEDEPNGFERYGRFAVVPAGQPGFGDVTARSSVISFVSEVWTDGSDVFTIEQGATQGATPFGDDPNAQVVKAGELGKGELLYSMVASEARFLTGGARFVRVRGTLAPSKLLEIARSLEGVPGGPLRLKDPPD